MLLITISGSRSSRICGLVHGHRRFGTCCLHLQRRRSLNMILQSTPYEYQLLSSDFSVKTMNIFLVVVHATCPTHPTIPDLITATLLLSGSPALVRSHSAVKPTHYVPVTSSVRRSADVHIRNCGLLMRRSVVESARRTTTIFTTWPNPISDQIPARSFPQGRLTQSRVLVL
jgi:hypothetical protein